MKRLLANRSDLASE